MLIKKGTILTINEMNYLITPLLYDKDDYCPENQVINRNDATDELTDSLVGVCCVDKADIRDDSGKIIATINKNHTVLILDEFGDSVHTVCFVDEIPISGYIWRYEVCTDLS